MLKSPNHLHDLPLFKDLSGEERQRLWNMGRVRKISAGNMLFRHGEPVTHFYIVADGCIQLFRVTPDGHQLTQALMNPGRTIGENEIMDGFITYRENAAAVNDAVVMEYPATWVKEMARKNGTFALNLLSSMAEQTDMAKLEIEHQATMTAAQLVACFLQRLCVLYNLDPNGYELPYSKSLIASRLGMELETFSRALNRLKDHGITVKGSHVTINDPGGIADYVCGSCSVADDCPTHAALANILKSQRRHG